MSPLDDDVILFVVLAAGLRPVMAPVSAADGAALFQPPAAAYRRSWTSLQPPQDNAVRTVEAFSLQLRVGVDLDTLSAELLGVVDQTMQPTTTSWWLRPTAELLASDRGRES